MWPFLTVIDANYSQNLICVPPSETIIGFGASHGWVSFHFEVNYSFSGAQDVLLKRSQDGRRCSRRPEADQVLADGWRTGLAKPHASCHFISRLQVFPSEWQVNDPRSMMLISQGLGRREFPHHNLNPTDYSFSTHMARLWDGEGLGSRTDRGPRGTWSWCNSYVMLMKHTQLSICFRTDRNEERLSEISQEVTFVWGIGWGWSFHKHGNKGRAVGLFTVVEITLQNSSI